MTIEELANLTAEKLEALSDKQLIEILSPYFNVTRPELVQRVTEHKQSNNKILNLTPEKQKALALLQEEGVDLSFLMRRK
jgi:hypothetical protein